MGPKTLRFWLLVVLTFALTRPGSIASTNFDAPYDRPLVIAWLVTWLILATLLVGYIKGGREKTKEPEGRGPSESS